MGFRTIERREGCVEAVGPRAAESFDTEPLIGGSGLGPQLGCGGPLTKGVLGITVGLQGLRALEDERVLVS